MQTSFIPRIVIAPDSFKGTLSAAQAAHAMATGLSRIWPEADLHLHPMADGGEGTLEAVAAAMPAQWQHAVMPDLEGRLKPARWLRLPDGSAVIESAELVGITLVGSSQVADRSTLGLGQLLLAVLDAGCARVLLGLGGTGTNDGGVGLLAALGARFLDGRGLLLPPTLASLADLAVVDLSGLDSRLAQTRLVALADVASPLCGATGATAVFGPQKGVRSEELDRFDRRLQRLGELGDAVRGQDLRDQPGSGAAGGLGWALRLLGATLEPGAEAIADLQKLDASLAGADWLLTGEGRSDAQTPLGKVPWRVAGRAARLAVPASLLSGDIDSAALPALQQRFDHCLALVGGAVDRETAQRDAASLLTDAAEAMARQHCELLAKR
ncbi:glycerate kinase [Chitinimonas prasina]|nr:glycerate kinase [Chitinimonas prasina]